MDQDPGAAKTAAIFAAGQQQLVTGQEIEQIGTPVF